MDSPRHKEHILVVDDSEPTVEIIRRNLESAGYHVHSVHSVAAALEVLDCCVVDLVVTDIKMPGASGMDLVRHVRENFGQTEVAVITGYPNVDGAVDAIKRGATDYLSKPFTDDELLAVVRRALERLERRRCSSTTLPLTTARHGLLGESRAMQRVFEQITRAARTDASVVVYGESGTGKELTARAIHYESKRAAASFVPVNCGAIPHELLESELFGHVKGAFTGAFETRAGFFLTADGGTIFLDEISETSPSMQVKLLRAIQEREVRMVGSPRSARVDIRIIAASNKDLVRLVEGGRFREDLYFRINVIPIVLPPLRERDGDVLMLAKHFAAKYSADLHRPVPEFSDRVLEMLRDYAWPGNVRELENLMQRLVVMTDRPTIDAADLPALMRFSARSNGELGRTLAEVEAGFIRRVLDRVDGNKTKAAQILGIDRKTLRAKLQLHRLDGSSGDDGAEPGR